MYISKTLQEENVHSNCLMGFNILDKLEGWTQEKKNPYGDLDFLNFVRKSIGSSVGKKFCKFLPWASCEVK